MAKAFLQITLVINKADRANAADVYTKYKAPFLETVKGAESKELLIREEDVQVLHGFDTAENARTYLSTELFSQDVVEALKPYLSAAPQINIYSVV